MDLKEIKELIKFFEKTSLSELEIDKDNVKVRFRKEVHGTELVSRVSATSSGNPPVAPPASASAHAADAKSPAGESGEEKSHIIRAPMVGTFYRASGPEKEPFVKTGDMVEKGNVMCVIEAMKIFNEIESDISGKVIKIFAENAQPVEFDQPLFLIERT